MDTTTPSFFDTLIQNAQAYVSAYTSASINRLAPAPAPAPSLPQSFSGQSNQFLHTTTGKLVLAAVIGLGIVWFLKK